MKIVLKECNAGCQCFWPTITEETRLNETGRAFGQWDENYQDQSTYARPKPELIYVTSQITVVYLR